VRRRGACDSRGQLNNASLHRRSTFDEQRNAIAEIAYGRAKGNGPFALFAATLRYVLDPEFVPIEMRVDGKRSRFAVPGVLEVELAPHVDPISGEEHEVRVDLPNGFIFKSAQAIKTAAMRILSSSFNFDYSGEMLSFLSFSFKDHDGGTPMIY